MYKYEMHAHCSEVSKCAQSSATQMVEAHAATGYSGIVFTDHFIFGNTAIPRHLPWQERMAMQFDAYVPAVACGKALGIDVFFGLEHHYGGGKEVLVYGDISGEFLSAHPEIEQMNIEAFIAFCHQQGWFVAQAHPCRQRDYIDDNAPMYPSLLDGIEVYNYCNQPYENVQADALCREYGLVPISGSDTHSVSLCGNAGMAFGRRIQNGKALAKALFAGKGRLIIDGTISER